MTQPRPDRDRDHLKENPRNIPAHVVFWLVVIGLLYLFYRAFAH